MRKCLGLALLLLTSVHGFSQFGLGITGGLSNYLGDLVDKPYKSTKGYFGVTGTFPLSPRFSLRAGLSFAKVAGADSLAQQPELVARNLSFQSRITELSLLAEYNIFNIEQVRWTPYVFAGLAVFRFDPYTYDASGIQTFLRPLGTEGQGAAGYPAPYALTHLAIPFGGGIRYAISEKVHLGLELGIRKLFTDYLDDVSGGYADPGELLAGPGGLRAVDLAYRGDELPGGNPVAPEKGFTRGNPAHKDYYYFTGLHLSFRIGKGREERGLGCPTVGF